LGEINFTIIKSVNNNQIEIGDKIIVILEVENTGTISIEDIKVNDMISYSQADFSLIEGNLINLINSLDPGEKVTLNYTIRSKRQVLVNLKPASIKFHYLHENEVFSNTITIKIITPKTIQFFYVGLPILMVLIISSIYIWQTKKYKKKKRAIQRSEMYLFELSSRETILKIDSTLRERLNIILRNSKSQIMGTDNNQDIDKIIKDDEEREI
jgi:uncharacterized repeat protein (TIGR01451 family)